MGLQTVKLLRIYKCILLFAIIFGLTDRAEAQDCPVPCSCLGRIVDCSKRNFSFVSVKLPLWTAELDLSGNGLSSVNSSYPWPPALKSLVLSHNHFISLPVLLNAPQLTQLRMSYNNIEVMSAESLSYLPALQNLDLSHNKLTSLSLPNMPALQQLIVNNNRIGQLEKGVFDNVTLLQVLKLSKNRIQAVRKNTFINLTRLRHLELNRNRIQYLEGLAFFGMSSLVSLHLRYNAIASVPDGTFGGLDKLTHLYLDGNSVTSVRRGWLYGLSAVTTLSLAHNNISDIDKESWNFCTLLVELDLSHNALRTLVAPMFDQLTSLRSLSVSHNSISSIVSGVFTRLTHLNTLDVSHNEWAWSVEGSGSPFAGLTSLTKLSLNNNNIELIGGNLLAGLSQLTQVNFYNNPIHFVDQTTLTTLPQLHSLLINSTALVCDCRLSWLRSWLVSRGSCDQTLTCHLPDTVRGSRLCDVSTQDFLCSDLAVPVIMRQPVSQIVLRSHNLSLECEAAVSVTSDSPVSVQWRKDGQVVSGEPVTLEAQPSEGQVLRYVSQFTVSQVQDSHSGIYTCVFNNNFGTVSSSKAQISVMVFPTFTKIPSLLAVRAGSVARFECAATGVPDPEIAWQKDGGNDFPAARDRRMDINPVDDIYSINGVKQSDQGIYSCMATNPAGVIVANVSLTVLEKPTFAKRMESRASVEGSTTVLECHAAGNPKPRLEWLKDGEGIDVTERHYLTADNQLLVIVQTVPSDAGVYTCLMTNTVGSEKGNMRLTVVPQAGLPNGTVAWHTGAAGDSLTVGVIVIAVVCCVVGTSVVWVVIIYHTRKRAAAYRAPPRLLTAHSRLDYCDQDHPDNDSAFYEQQELHDATHMALHSASCPVHLNRISSSVHTMTQLGVTLPRQPCDSRSLRLGLDHLYMTDSGYEELCTAEWHQAGVRKCTCTSARCAGQHMKTFLPHASSDASLAPCIVSPSTTTTSVSHAADMRDVQSPGSEAPLSPHSPFIQQQAGHVTPPDRVTPPHQAGRVTPPGHVTPLQRAGCVTPPIHVTSASRLLPSSQCTGETRQEDYGCEDALLGPVDVHHCDDSGDHCEHI